jgi:alkylation response protein AidB-like acyl-CoA dehydrogenase
MIPSQETQYRDLSFLHRQWRNQEIDQFHATMADLPHFRQRIADLRILIAEARSALVTIKEKTA